MEKITAVNTVLAYLGEHKVTSVDSTHSTVDLILDAIERQRITLLDQGWWFSDYTITLDVSSDGTIPVPYGTKNLYGVDNPRLDMRKGKLYLNGSYIFTTAQRVQLVENVIFEELPDLAALYCAYQAAVEVYTQDFGVESTVQVLSQQAASLRSNLLQEELRKRARNSVRNTRRRYGYTGGYR